MAIRGQMMPKFQRAGNLSRSFAQRDLVAVETPFPCPRLGLPQLSIEISLALDDRSIRLAHTSYRLLQTVHSWMGRCSVSFSFPCARRQIAHSLYQLV